MALFINKFVLTMFVALLSVACAGGAPDSTPAPEPIMESEPISTGNTTCVDIPMQIGGTKRVCCKEGEQPTPYRSSCGDEVSVACNAPNAPQTKCVYRTSLQEEILCPDGLDCTQCGTGDQAGMAFWCGSI